MPESFDVTVIGAGPEEDVAIRASQVGLKAALIEKDKDLGWLCMSRGCFPTEELLNSSQINDSGTFGISVEGAKIHFDKVMTRKNRVVAKLSDGVDFSMEKRKSTVFLNSPGKFERFRELTEKDRPGALAADMLAEARVTMSLEEPAEQTWEYNACASNAVWSCHGSGRSCAWEGYEHLNNRRG